MTEFMKRHCETYYAVEINGDHLALAGGLGYSLFHRKKAAIAFAKELRNHVKAPTKVVRVRVSWEWE